MYTARWPLQHVAFVDITRYRLSQKRSISTDEMYSTICVEWASDQIGLCLT